MVLLENDILVSHASFFVFCYLTFIQRDEEDMVEFVRNCPKEFKEYYIQMQTAKRSQAPLPSQVMRVYAVIWIM